MQRLNKPIAKAPELTEEQKTEMKQQAIIQKRASLIEGYAFNLSQNSMIEYLLGEDEDIVDLAVRLAEKTLDKALGIKVNAECSKD